LRNQSSGDCGWWCGHVLVNCGSLGLFRFEAAASKLARQQLEELVGAEGFMGIDEEATGGLLEDELGVGSEEVAFE
jgi:hypothetical protein